jgi:hypothetical protein
MRSRSARVSAELTSASSEPDGTSSPSASGDAYRRGVLARHWPGVPCFEGHLLATDAEIDEMALRVELGWGTPRAEAKALMSRVLADAARP